MLEAQELVLNQYCLDMKKGTIKRIFRHQISFSMDNFQQKKILKS